MHVLGKTAETDKPDFTTEASAKTADDNVFAWDHSAKPEFKTIATICADSDLRVFAKDSETAKPRWAIPTEDLCGPNESQCFQLCGDTVRFKHATVSKTVGKTYYIQSVTVSGTTYTKECWECVDCTGSETEISPTISTEYDDCTACDTFKYCPESQPTCSVNFSASFVIPVTNFNGCSDTVTLNFSGVLNEGICGVGNLGWTWSLYGAEQNLNVCGCNDVQLSSYAGVCVYCDWTDKTAGSKWIVEVFAGVSDGRYLCYFVHGSVSESDAKERKETCPKGSFSGSGWSVVIS